MSLPELGWTEVHAAAFAASAPPGCEPGRVIAQHADRFRVATREDELAAELPGRLRHRARGPDELPAVGDWIALERVADRGRIQAVLPRRSCFARAAAGGRTAAQVVAANLDRAFVVAGLDADLNLPRLERYLSVAWEGGVEPIILLNKADLCADPETQVAAVEARAPGVTVHAISARGGELSCLEPYLLPGATLALLGSSGVGKSTIANALLGAEVQTVHEVSANQRQRGQHTTTARELFRLPSGALLIDTPGMRELGLLDGAEGLSRAFADLEALAADCRFRDCRHEREPACAVHTAIAEGRLEAGRLTNYRKLLREQRAAARRSSAAARQAEKRRVRAVHKRRRKAERTRWR